MTCITFVVPYRGLDDVVADCLSEFRQEPVAFDLTHLIGVEEVRAFSFENDIVIARGITCAAIRDLQPDLTTIEIPVTGYDVLRAVDEARRSYHSRRIAIIGAPKMVSGAQDLGRYIDGLEIRCYPVSRESDAEIVIDAALAAGVDSIIGGLMVYDIARERGLPATWIRSGPDALRQAAGEAVLAAKIQTRERERSEFLNVVMDYTHEAILAVDRTGRVTTANRTAHRIIGTDRSPLVGANVQQIRPLRGLLDVLENGREDVGGLQSVADGMIATNFVPIVIGSEVAGAVATFQPATSIQEVERRIRRRAQAKGLVPKYSFADILGESPEIMLTKQTALRFSKVDSNILMIGETGTGKELFAHSIHSLSARRNGPFVAVNCAALPESLLESELFGYTEGAFTGASKAGKAGLFELAHDGTIFLDEIGEIPLTLQAKLLRVLQEREIMRLGGDRVIPVDVRVIAAANDNLKEQVEQGRFRSDILYRIDVLRINVPPLRRRQRDIVVLAEHYLAFFCHKFSVPRTTLSPEAQELLLRYHWPGNVRELINLCERLAALAPDRTVSRNDVAQILEVEDSLATSAVSAAIPNGTPSAVPAATAAPAGSAVAVGVVCCRLRDAERELILRELERNGQNRAETARALGISRSTLWRKLRQADR